jgi:RNA polymerase sigma-70 factor, ECF subfamily
VNKFAGPRIRYYGKTQMDDRAAIERVLNGESEAFRHLVERYQGQALAHAGAILGDRSDAQDAAQEAFIDAYNSLARFDRGCRFYPWFYVLLRNRCFKMLSARKPAENIDEMDILAERRGVAPEERISLERALKNMKTAEREIVMLKYLDGLSYKEIAEYLDIPVGTVMSRLFHARRSLQVALTTGL